VDLGARLPPRSPRGPPRDPQPRGRREDHHPGRRDQIPESNFVRGRVVDVDTNEQVVETDDGTTVDYDYLLLGVGSTTAFFGIEGLEENAHQLKSLADAKAIHEDVRSAAAEATRSDPVEVIVGGAGLSGIQTAGEIAEYRDKHRAPVDIKLVEGLDEVFPATIPSFRARSASGSKTPTSKYSPATSSRRPMRTRCTSAAAKTRSRGTLVRRADLDRRHHRPAGA